MSMGWKAGTSGEETSTLESLYRLSSGKTAEERMVLLLSFFSMNIDVSVAGCWAQKHGGRFLSCLRGC